MKLVYCYTPPVIMPPYINISEHDDNLGYSITMRSYGERSVSVMSIPKDELVALRDAITKHLGE